MKCTFKSTVPQRFVVGRHACPFGLQDFWIGASISIRGVTLHIVDADDYTRESWAKNDAELGPRLPNPATKDDATKSVANEHGALAGTLECIVS